MRDILFFMILLTVANMAIIITCFSDNPKATTDESAPTPIVVEPAPVRPSVIESPGDTVDEPVYDRPVTESPEELTYEPVYAVPSVEAPSEYSVEDLVLAARVVFSEACGESYDGKLAVASVIVNRISTPGYPSSLERVVYQKNAFSPVTGGSRLWLLSDQPDKLGPAEAPAWYDSLRAVEQAFSGLGYPDIIAFRVVGHQGGNRYFSQLTWVRDIGNHSFYR